MNIKLVEQFIQEMMPPEGKSTVNLAFECMKANPISAVPTIGTFLQQLQQRLYSYDEAEQSIAARNVLTGVMICWATEHPELQKILIDGFLERGKKLRGDNVVDFFSKKAEMK